MSEPTRLPGFMFDEDTTARDQIRYIERGIQDNPEAFKKALERLGSVATAGTLGISDIDTELTTLEQGASGLLTAFFSKRYDMLLSFDDATEDALAEDTAHRELIDIHRGIKSINSTKSTMQHELLANPAAEPARDAVRRSRLAFYIARTIDAVQIATHQTELPSAS